MVTEDTISEDIWLTSVPSGYAVLDTGCTTSIVGEETSKTLSQYFQSQGCPAPTPCQLPPLELKYFSKHRVVATKGLRWTVKLGQLWGSISTYVVPGEAPFLLSRRVLKGMKAKLDMEFHTITSKKHGIFEEPLRQASNGHLLMPLINVPPELTTPSLAPELATPSLDQDHQEEDEPNTCPEHFAVTCEDPPVPVAPRPGKVTTSDRRRALQHIVTNTRKWVVNAPRFKTELEQLFGSKSEGIVHAIVAYRPRLERIPNDAATMSYQRSVASLTDDGKLHVQPRSTRQPGETRRSVSQVNVCLFVYANPEPAVESQLECAKHFDHQCYCCRECDSEGEEVYLQNDGWSLETLYGESTDWNEASCMSPMTSEVQEKLQQGIQRLRKTYAQFITSRLQDDPQDVLQELSEWLGPQADRLHEPVSMIEVFTGKAPLSQRVEALGSKCIRIGLDYGQDLNQHYDRRKLLLLIAYCRPKDVWISFPCGCWGPWSRFNTQRDPKLAESTLAARQTARRHLSIAPEIWNLQQSLGGHTHIENPLTSDARKEFTLSMAFDIRNDQCSLGLRCPR